MNKILIIVQNKFYKDTAKKYGVDILKKYYEIFVIDVSKIIKPHTKNENFEFQNPEYKFFRINSLSDFSDLIQNNKFMFVVDWLAYSKQAYDIRKIIYKKNINVIKKQGVTPHIISSISNFLIVNFYKPIRNSIYAGNFSHSLGISEGICSDKNFFIKRSREKLYSHSFDYNEYLNFNKEYFTNKRKYAVFIDDLISNHTDYKDIHNVKPPTDPITYINEIKIFFDKFEQETNLEIIVAPHPKSEKSYKEKIVNKRYQFYGETIELIKNCEVVLAHETTAISFPIIFEKPIIFLNNNQIKKSWMNKFINLKAQTIGSNVLNISEYNYKSHKIDINKFDKKKYDEYVKNYIKHPKSDNVDTWKLLIQKINSL